ncbi:MAG: hypothetical protein WCA44_16940, partial [Acidobacteriaceae bacterium]
GEGERSAEVMLLLFSGSKGPDESDFPGPRAPSLRSGQAQASTVVPLSWHLFCVVPPGLMSFL